MFKERGVIEIGVVWLSYIVVSKCVYMEIEMLIMVELEGEPPSITKNTQIIVFVYSIMVMSDIQIGVLWFIRRGMSWGVE